MGGQCLGYWYQDDKQGLTPVTFCCLEKYCLGSVFSSVTAALASSSPVAATQVIIDGASVKANGWSETHDFNCLHDNMIRALQATKPIATGPVWVVSSTAAYPLNPDGTRSITPWPVAPTKGSACDPTVTVVQFGVTWMKVPSLSVGATVVAGCVKK